MALYPRLPFVSLQLKASKGEGRAMPPCRCATHAGGGKSKVRSAAYNAVLAEAGDWRKAVSERSVPAATATIVAHAQLDGCLPTVVLNWFP